MVSAAIFFLGDPETMGPEATQENIVMLDVLLQASESGNQKLITDALEDFEGDLKIVINANVDGVNGIYIEIISLVGL